MTLHKAKTPDWEEELLLNKDRGAGSVRRLFWREEKEEVMDFKAINPAKQAWSLFDEFKAFAFKGNVIDLAVGVIIGGAFGNIVNSLVHNIIMPLVGVVMPGEHGYENWVDRCPRKGQSPTEDSSGTSSTS